MLQDSAVPFVDLNAQHDSIRDEIEAAIRGVIERGDFVLGEELVAFEQEFAEFTGAMAAVGVSSGLAALRLALTAAGVGPGDEVITAANTFVATVLAIRQTGATAKLVDVQRETANLDPELLAAAITPQTKAVIPVHLFGQTAAMHPIRQAAADHGLTIIEDAAQAHGARYQSESAGNMGLGGCFSFYPSKNLGALGDGGAVVSNDPEFVERLRKLRNYGQAVKHRVDIDGGNERLDTLQAAVLRVKLRKLATWNEQRRRHAARYREQLSDLPLDLPCEVDGCRHVYHLFVVGTDARDALAEHLRKSGIATGIHYPIPISKQPAFRGEAFAAKSFPVTETLAGRSLSLPMYPELSEVQIDRVCEAIRGFFVDRQTASR